MITLTEQEAKLVVYHLRKSNSLIEAQGLANKIEKQLEPVQVNNCDYGHTTTEIVKKLPIGDNAFAICCFRHFTEQVISWIESNDPRAEVYIELEMVKGWDSLEIYDPVK